MVDIMEPGLTQGNLLVTIGVVSVLVLICFHRVLDRTGVYAAAALGVTVGALGHWTWLVILPDSLNGNNKATKWRFEEKAMKGLSESSDGHRSWGNVVANGGLPGLVAIIAFLLDDHENGLWLFSAAVSVAALFRILLHLKSVAWTIELG